MPDLHESNQLRETNPFEQADLRDAWKEGWKAFWAGLPQPKVTGDAGKEIRAFMRGHEDAQMHEE